jgi:ketosteroid isomerase-like protein
MSNVDVVRDLYAAFAARDVARIRALFHPNIEWNQNAGFPNGGRHVGVDVVLNDVFGKFRTEWSAWAVVVHEYLDAGDAIIAIGDYGGTYKSTGRSMSAAFAHVYDVRGGRITRFRQFTDTAMLRAAMSPPCEALSHGS